MAYRTRIASPVVTRSYEELAATEVEFQRLYNEARDRRDNAYKLTQDDAVYNALQAAEVDPAYARLQRVKRDAQTAWERQVKGYEKQYGLEY